jgi:pimeloyl-ACP methyl ester carboxylesterase
VHLKIQGPRSRTLLGIVLALLGLIRTTVVFPNERVPPARESSAAHNDGHHATGVPASVNFTVVPNAPSMGDQVHVTISGLPAEQSIAIQTTSRAQDGVIWKSRVLFQSSIDGRIDLASQAPSSGDYSGVDSMGIFWSMKPEAEPKSGDHSFFAVTDWKTPLSSTIDVSRNGQRIASVTIERRFANAGIRHSEVRENGLVGCLWEPDDDQLRPGVVILGGSEGGYENCEAPMLASQGFRVLSLAYFGVRGLPPTLQRLPLEYFEHALQWFRARHGVAPRFFALYGISRGAEAALSVAAAYPEVTAVVARSPSHVRWEGTSAMNLPGGAVWTVHGEPLPYVPIKLSRSFTMQFLHDRLAGAPSRQMPLFVENLRLFGNTTKAQILVEQIHGPVLLLSGKDDQIWPSALMADEIMRRLRRNQHPFPDRHLSYDGVGHWMPTAVVPMRGSRQNMKLQIGGSPEQTAKMQADSWPKIVLFLVEASKGAKEVRPRR